MCGLWVAMLLASVGFVWLRGALLVAGGTEDWRDLVSESSDELG
jgi:hypothetical protein